MKKIMIKENDANQRIDKYLQKLLCNASSNFIYKMFRKKDRLSKDLRVKRMQLEEVNNGKILYDKNKKVFTNCLTFPKVGDIIENKM